MARKAPMKYVPLEERPLFLALVADLANVPAEQFPEIAQQCVDKYHDAVLAGHIEVLDQMEAAYTALVFKLNGETLVGCAADESSSANALLRAVAAKPGQAPRWGSAGEFLLEVEGLRVRVVIRPDLLGNHHACALWAVDLDRPFVSASGYRSAGLTATNCLGLTVDQAARALVLDLLQIEGKLKPIAADDLERLRRQKVPGWLSDALAGVLPDGQLSMFGDAPKDPNAKVPMSNADRQRALRKRRKDQQLKPVMLNESERLLVEQLREAQARGIPSEGPRPFLLSQRDRTYLTGALDLYEYSTPNLHGSNDYMCNNLRDLYVRLSVHKTDPQETDFPAKEKRQGWAHERITQSLFDEYERKIAALDREKQLLESERNKAHTAIKTWEDRLRAAGLSTDYRKQPGE